jgi:hypothetical protein
MKLQDSLPPIGLIGLIEHSHEIHFSLQTHRFEARLVRLRLNSHRAICLRSGNEGRYNNALRSFVGVEVKT